MGEFGRLLLPAAVTVLTGVVVLVAGQVVVRFVIDPWHEQRKAMGCIAEALVRYAGYVAHSDESPPNGVDDARAHLRRLSAELLARSWAVTGYTLLAACGLVPTMESLREASGGLNGLANTLHQGRWQLKTKYANQVSKGLKLESIAPIVDTND